MFETDELPYEKMLERYVEQINFIPAHILEARKQKKHINPVNIVIDDYFKRRHSFHDEDLKPDQCPVYECHLRTDQKKKHEADVIIWESHSHVTIGKVPPEKDPRQIWVWLHWEAPINSYFEQNHSYNMNWTAAFRHDSTFYTPYGLYIPNEYIEKLKGTKMNYVNIVKQPPSKRPKKVVAMMSNCRVPSGRLDLVMELKKYITVDIYGRGQCAEYRCPGLWQNHDCYYEFAKSYKFFLSYENSLCKQYITEKFIHNTHSYVHVIDFFQSFCQVQILGRAKKKKVK